MKTQPQDSLLISYEGPLNKSKNTKIKKMVYDHSDFYLDRKLTNFSVKDLGIGETWLEWKIKAVEDFNDIDRFTKAIEIDDSSLTVIYTENTIN